MRHLCALALLSVPFVAASAQPPAATGGLKGQVVLPAGATVPERAKLNVNQDQAHCLSKGPLLDEKLFVNAKNRGVKNVVVWLRPDNADPTVKFTAKDLPPDDAKRKPAEIVIDQPCCVFIPRIALARVGDKVIVKNPAPVAHNFRWVSAENGELNVTLASKETYKFEKPLVAESSAIPFSCTIHPWMQGQLRVFDHPYFALTDSDGRFEMKNVPAGKYRIVYWHESTGFKGGQKGRSGTPIAVSVGTTLDLQSADFAVK